MLLVTSKGAAAVNCCSSFVVSLRGLLSPPFRRFWLPFFQKKERVDAVAFFLCTQRGVRGTAVMEDGGGVEREGGEGGPDPSLPGRAPRGRGRRRPGHMQTCIHRGRGRG